jgi:photosystem II stability/assembly factor-like uncharacterized protein
MRRLAAVTLACLAFACSSEVLYPVDAGVVGAVPDGSVGDWVVATSNLAGMTSECGDLSFVSTRPDQDVIIAGVAQDGLWSEANGATTWTRLGTGAGSATIRNRASSIVYDSANPLVFWESGTYNDNAVYRTNDGGKTFQALGNATHSDAVSVDLTDPARKILLAGGHEDSVFWFSNDSGATWSNIYTSLPGSPGYASSPLVLDSQTLLVGTYSNATGSGIFRSSNGGANWTRVFTLGVRAQPLQASDGNLYWGLDNDGGIARSTDKGVTWTPVAGSAGVVSTIQGGPSLLELPDGRFAALGQKAIIVSKDHGATWTSFGPTFPWSPRGLAYSKFRKAFFIWHFGCSFSGDTVPADAILATPFDYTTQ